ncbi:MAG: cell division protein FtsL [Treponema sp.]|nr:cell division protein FtsL [Treponema sp.]
MKKHKNVIKTVVYIVTGVLIPALLILNAMQAQRYHDIEKEVHALEVKQAALVEENKKLITDISILSSAQRIGKVAEEQLGMHKAETKDIVRVDMPEK